MTRPDPRKTIAERLDDSVRWTGLPLNVEHPRRRSLRWLSITVLLLAGAGFAMTFGQPKLGWGYSLLIIGFSISNFLPIWGPIKPWGTVEQVDEFDRALRARAFLLSFSLLAVTAVAGLWAIVALSMQATPSVDAIRLAAISLSFLLTVIYTAGPTCYASWTLGRSADDDGMFSDEKAG